VAVITGVAPVHLEFFQNLEEIALAKKEILEGARDSALAVLNGDDLLVRKIAAGYPREQVVFFGSHDDCLVRAENLKLHGLSGLSLELIFGQDRAPVRLPFLNQVLVSNFLAACAVAFSLGLKLEDIIPAFSDLPETEHRGQLLQFKNGIKIYDDSYNSNPVALTSVLKSLSQVPARRKIAVLGDMLELGPQEPEFHRQAGRKIAEYGWNVLVTVGERARYLAEGAVDSGFDPGCIFSFSEATRAGSWLESFIQAGDFILVKGSHSLAMDRIVLSLKKVMEK
jgi:UDP-N-acetylmuramoyl-tripeptide--D-alanyl-D-alanine ligase